ncbi:MAG: hypothetical protein AABX37_05935 [Nanoarchaeota archaeon]
MEHSLEHLAQSYPAIPLLDIYYLSLKHLGVQDKDTLRGRPTWNLIDSSSLFHVTFGTSEGDSPFSIEGTKLLHDGRELPFRADFVERVPVTNGRYFYFRSTDHMTPTLDDQMVLNLNFRRQCFSCDFCQFNLYRSQPNISEEEGFQRIVASRERKDLRDVNEIAIVTGCFGSSEKAMVHIEKVARIAASLGFTGRLLYMGSEIEDKDQVQRVLGVVEEAGLSGFRMIYTVEMFQRRDRLMKGRKQQKSIQEINDTLRSLKDLDVNHLEYTYIPGLDTLDDFKLGAEMLKDVALPHICVFRPWRKRQREEQATRDYIERGPAYLCEMRVFYESLYGGPMYGNNLANLWPFPLARISPFWVEQEIVGDVVGKRYWKSQTDLRNAVACESSK